MASGDWQTDSLKEFIREMTMGVERGVRRWAERSLWELRAEVGDLRDQSRAQTQALLRIIDRLDRGGPAPAG